LTNEDIYFNELLEIDLNTLSVNLLLDKSKEKLEGKCEASLVSYSQ
jgi:hypothetical protein